MILFIVIVNIQPIKVKGIMKKFFLLLFLPYGTVYCNSSFAAYNQKRIIQEFKQQKQQAANNEQHLAADKLLKNTNLTSEQKRELSALLDELERIINKVYLFGYDLSIFSLKLQYTY